MRYCAPTRIDFLKMKQMEAETRQQSEARFSEICNRPTNDALLAGLCNRIEAEQLANNERPNAVPFSHWLGAKVARLALGKASFTQTSTPPPLPEPILVDGWPMPSLTDSD